MKHITIIAVLCMTGIMACHTGKTGDRGASSMTSMAGASVEKRFQEIAGDISTRCAAFAREVALDQLFSLRLLAEDNRSAPEVTRKAGGFIGPMGFSCLTVLDSVGTILSSGEFEASAGNNASAKAARLDRQSRLYPDTIMGQATLTLQAKVPFTIADSIRFCVLGGVVVDSAFLAGLSPCAGVRVLLKHGASVLGMPGLRTISDVKDGKILLNDKEYPAFQIALPFAGEGETPALIVAVDEPTAVSKGK